MHVPATNLTPLAGPAQKLFDSFAPGIPPAWIADRYAMPGRAALLLHTLLASLGPDEPVLERDVRAIARILTTPAAATAQVLAFLDEHALLAEDRQGDSTEASVHDLGTARADRRHERALLERIARLPEPFPDQLLTWAKVMRGRGRRRHPPADFPRIRRYLRIVWPALTSWAEAGLDLRQITPDHIRAELARHSPGAACGMLSALRSVFRALRQERLIFRDLTTVLQASGGVHLPLPLPSDRLAGILDDLDGPAARLIVGLVAIHAVRAVEVARLALDDIDLANRTLAIHRRNHIHTVYLDDLSTRLVTTWLNERRRRWPQATNRHLLISTHTY
ncbi:hypothetical protein [Streptomyces erythrochromogenes]|uniref:hypothetical protein n=1 Tax=Streptomyces erythrochromogenes TaxID=285574 RepID=UPI003824CCB1